MQTLIEAIEENASQFQILMNQSKSQPKQFEPQPDEMGGLSEALPIVTATPQSGIINLRFEECQIHSKAV